MIINSAGSHIEVEGRVATTKPININVTNFFEEGRPCIEACLNGGGWRRRNSSWSPTSDTSYYNVDWEPIYFRGEDGQLEFAECGCPAFNSTYTPRVSVSLTGIPGQPYTIAAGRTSFDPPGGEIVDTGSSDQGYVEGVIGDEGVAHHEFVFRLLHAETDGTLPPPTLHIRTAVGSVLPAIEAGVMARQEIFAECFANCSRESVGVSVPWLKGCRVDLRDSVVSAARAYTGLPVKALAQENLAVTLRNIVSPSIQDVVVARLALPNMTVRLGLKPIATPLSFIAYDERLSVFLVNNFSNTGEPLGTPKIDRISPWASLRTPNVPLSEYSGRENRLVIMKDKWPGRSTDYSSGEFEGSCDLSGEWFLSYVGDSSST